MRDISKRLTVINTEKKDNASDSKGQSSGVTYVGLGGGGVRNLNDYLLKSIWDRVWEIRTDSQGTEYIFGKLPVVTQYGITMYSGENTDIPTIAEGLPFDRRTIWFNPTTGQIEVIGGTGGGSGEGVSNFWDLSGIPSWITNTKPTYSYSEIQGTPDLSVYALKSDIPSLSGYATEQWVLGKGYALSSDLSKYIPIAGVTDITGEKNFVGGLKVNGSPIYYDTDKKYWKLEGDLLVTGGVTMFGNDSEFTPSTIMDAILYDDTTLGINAQGQLYVKGSVGGATTMGSLSNVGSWADSVASQDRIMYQAANSSQWVAKNLSDLTVGGVTGNYLPLSGGTLTNTLTIDNSNVGLILHRSGQATPYIRFGQDANNEWGELGVYNDGRLVFWPLVSSQGGYGQWNTVWHSGNDGSGSGLDADLLDGIHSYDFFRKVAWNPDINSYGDGSNANGIIYINTSDNDAIHAPFKYGSILSMNYDAASWMLSCSSNGSLGFRHRWWSGNGTVWSDWKTIALTDSNVASATKLQTARTIWGQSFNGTGNIDGQLIINASTSYPIRIIQSSNLSWTSAFLATNSSLTAGQHYSIDFGHSVSAYNAAWVGYYHAGVGSTSNRLSMGLNSVDDVINILGTGNVGIGTTSPYSKLHSVGDITISVQSNNPTASINLMNTPSDFWQISGRYIGSEKGTFKTYYYNGSTWSTIMTLYNNGNMLVTGGVTMYSDARKKTILNHVELSLKEIAEAPLIEHYYNSDEKKTTHVGSIAQYWAGLNDWFCKLDNEGYYTMEIQNAALASAISVARELVKFETETDRRIRLLEEENEQLKKEIEILKWNIA